MIEVRAVTDATGKVVAPEWLHRAEAVHRQLRPSLPTDYAARMAVILAGGGRMFVAASGNEVVGVAVYRVTEDTNNGRKCYVDDLVTDQPKRSTGVGRALMQALEREARRLGCDVLALDSGTHRVAAHKFYFREGMTISSFNFKKTLR
ncbi:MAG: GNAT family N-acetyltransferase [Betaproteobacteria bacterium]|nr:GNAT family N-acetyltransferase [Betaproteobacteria bacterium]